MTRTMIQFLTQVEAVLWATLCVQAHCAYHFARFVLTLPTSWTVHTRVVAVRGSYLKTTTVVACTCGRIYHATDPEAIRELANLGWIPHPEPAPPDDLADPNIP